MADLLYWYQELWCSTALDSWAVWDLPQLQNSYCRLCTLQKDNFQHEWTLSRCYSGWAQCVSLLIHWHCFSSFNDETCLWFSFLLYIFRSDATCIICREEMTTAKKLLCGHLFHVHCLRSWLERQHTCPTCRAQIIPPDNGHAASVRQHGAQPGVQPGELFFVALIFLFHIFPLQPFVSVSSTSCNQFYRWFLIQCKKTAAGAGTPGSEGAPSENVNRRQAKLEAAASAASLYGRSFAYPPANTLNRYTSSLLLLLFLEESKM